MSRSAAQHPLKGATVNFKPAAAERPVDLGERHLEETTLTYPADAPSRLVVNAERATLSGGTAFEGPIDVQVGPRTRLGSVTFALDAELVAPALESWPHSNGRDFRSTRSIAPEVVAGLLHNNPAFKRAVEFLLLAPDGQDLTPHLDVIKQNLTRPAGPTQAMLDALEYTIRHAEKERGRVSALQLASCAGPQAAKAFETIAFQLTNRNLPYGSRVEAAIALASVDPRRAVGEFSGIFHRTNAVPQMSDSAREQAETTLHGVAALNLSEGYVNSRDWIGFSMELCELFSSVGFAETARKPKWLTVLSRAAGRAANPIMMARLEKVLSEPAYLNGRKADPEKLKETDREMIELAASHLRRHGTLQELDVLRRLAQPARVHAWLAQQIKDPVQEITSRLTGFERISADCKNWLAGFR